MMGKRKGNKMSLYDLAKDAVSLASKLQNIELTKLLVDIQRNALDMQDQLYQLQRKNQELQDEITRLHALWEQEQDVEVHDEPYITFKNDKKRIPYCENCWNKSHHKIRFIVHCTKPDYKCPECGMTLKIDESEDVTCD